MKKAILAIGVTVIFIITGFASATPTLLETTEQQDSTDYGTARLELDGEFDGGQGLGWFGFPLGFGKYFVIFGPWQGEVVSGTLTVDPIMGDEETQTLYSGDTISMKWYFGILDDSDEPTIHNVMNGIALGVTI